MQATQYFLLPLVTYLQTSKLSPNITYPKRSEATTAKIITTLNGCRADNQTRDGQHDQQGHRVSPSHILNIFKSHDGRSTTKVHLNTNSKSQMNPATQCNTVLIYSRFVFVLFWHTGTHVEGPRLRIYPHNGPLKP